MTAIAIILLAVAIIGAAAIVYVAMSKPRRDQQSPRGISDQRATHILRELESIHALAGANALQLREMRQKLDRLMENQPPVDDDRPPAEVRQFRGRGGPSGPVPFRAPRNPRVASRPRTGRGRLIPQRRHGHVDTG